MQEFTANTSNERLDKFIAEQTELTRAVVQSLIEKGSITVNGVVENKKYKLKHDDIIKITMPEPELADITAQDIPLSIEYEDDNFLIINKPKGMVVHPAAGNPDNTLVNALMHHCKDKLSAINGRLRPGIVHRIDKDTSGLLVVAKNDFAHQALAAQIKEHSFTREYEAIVSGNISKDYGTINAPIGRSSRDRKKMAVTDKNSKNAVTHFEVINRFKNMTHIKCTLETGRTHQIRVHMSYIGHPVLGDEVYGRKSSFKSLHGQCLHAKRLGFISPTTDEYIEFISELPDYFKEILQNAKSNLI